MNDLTQGSIGRHLVKLTLPIVVGMVFQVLYFLVDLYFVAHLGQAAIAGVSAAGNIQIIIMGLTQVLGVGAMALIANAVGRKDLADAGLIFNQSLVMSLVLLLATIGGGYALIDLYTQQLGADAATAEAGRQYLFAFLPGLALQFPMVAMGSALRGCGLAKPGMVVQVLTVILNAALAPVLIAGWLTGMPLGVAGAGWASTISIALGLVLMYHFFRTEQRHDRLSLGVDWNSIKPQGSAWARILKIGLPPGGEFVLMFIYSGAIYLAIRQFGAHAQAGFGVGSRVMQAIFLPAMAISFAVGPIAGQNMGAGLASRVRETFKISALAGAGVMLILTVLCQLRPDWLIQGFTDDPEVIATGATFLRVISLNFVASGFIFTCSGMFQALGNTVPALMSSATRLVTFVIPVSWLAQQPGFTLAQVWWASVITMTLQAVFSFGLLRRELNRRLSSLA